MDISTIIETVRTFSLEVAFLIFPALFFSLLIAIVIGVIQAVMQIQEQTLSFLPKLVVMFIVFYVMAPHILTRLVNVSKNLIDSIPSLVM